MPLHSHYIPAFTQVDGVHQKAACGRMVIPQEHSTEPMCLDCRRFLEMEPVVTHYVLPTERRTAMAVCGAMVRPGTDHSIKPSCEKCQRWIQEYEALNI
jgi:hypothetical protein